MSRQVIVTLGDGTKVSVAVEEGWDNNDIYNQAVIQNEAFTGDLEDATDRDLTSQQSVMEAAGDEIIGAGETMLTAATGMVGGLAGRAYGVVAGEEAGGDLANRLTYEPKTDEANRNLRGMDRFIKDYKLEGLPPAIIAPGRFRGTVTKKKLKSKDLPTRTQIKEAAIESYRKADEMGAVVKTSDFNTFGKQLTELLRKKGYREGNPDLGAIKVIIDELKLLGKQKGGVTLDNLQDLRELAGGALKKNDAQLNMLGLNTTHTLDDFLENIKPGMLKKGSGEAFAQWRLGRKQWSQQAKLKEMEWLQEKGNLTDIGKTVQRGEGLENFRKEIVTMLKNPKRLKMYSMTERQMMKEFAQGGKADKLLDFMSGLAPKTVIGQGVGLGVPVAAMGAFQMDPALALGAAAGGFGLGKVAQGARGIRLNRQKNNMIDDFKIGDGPDAQYGVNKAGIFDTTPLAVGGGLLDGVYDQYSGAADAREGATMEEDIPNEFRDLLG